MSLRGVWVVGASDSRAIAEFGNVILNFQDGGRLTYTIRSGTKDQMINLVYKVEGREPPRS